MYNRLESKLYDLMEFVVDTEVKQIPIDHTEIRNKILSIQCEVKSIKKSNPFPR
jgi:hypothetical protein